MNSSRRRVLVRGIGDIGSAVAHKLFTSGYLVVIHDSPRPTNIRRGMAFINAAFDGVAHLDGVDARRISDPATIDASLVARDAIVVYAGNFHLLRSALHPDILVDARMQFRPKVEDQRGSAELVIGVGPGFAAGENVDCAIETESDAAGSMLLTGETCFGAGEPPGVGSRSRFVRAPRAGIFSTTRNVGDHVDVGDLVARIDAEELRAPLSGVLSGLTYNGVSVRERARVIEIDPRDDAGLIYGRGERSLRIADGVLEAITQFVAAVPIG